MKLEDLTTQCHATETLDCELTRGLYEPKHFVTTTFKSGQQWTAQPELDKRLTKMDHASTTTQPRWISEAMIHTDSSYKKDTNLTGAGVYGYKEGQEIRISIRPSKPGPVHTINLAELMVIFEALQTCDNLTMATESANSLKSINKQLKNPKKHKNHVHKRLLTAITDLLLCRARRGLYSSRVLAKVKSHIGITDDEIAHQLADDAIEQRDADLAKMQADPDVPWWPRLVTAMGGVLVVNKVSMSGSSETRRHIILWPVESQVSRAS